jgi:hypothetical protein
MQKEYQSELDQKFEQWLSKRNAINTQQQLNNNKTENDWEEVKKIITESAIKTIGTLKPTKYKHECPIIAKLSIEQKELRLKIANTTNEDNKTKLQKERKQIIAKIKQQKLKIINNEIDKKTTEIESQKNGVKMFQAVRELTNNNRETVVVENEGETIAQPQEAAEIVAKYFSNLFYDSNIGDENNITTNKTPLNEPIETKEVSEAIKRLKNNKAGSDQIPGELFKYGSNNLSKVLSEIFNQIFTNDETLDAIGEGIMIVLQKPGKPKGPISSLRPIILLTMLRKTLSTITLKRIRPEVEKFISKSQSGFRENRSTADAVWAHKWMIARIQKFNEIIKILGIDMSRAFDTILRQKILDSLKSIIKEDSWRIIQKLLTNTTIKVKIANKYSTPFKTNIGAPQGDALSPVLFTIYLELALQEIRANCKRIAIDKTIPNEICYADDTDFITKSDETLDEIQSKAPVILRKWNLEMNSTKTEITTLKREKTVEQELWRKTKKLGTMLGDNEEIKRRKQLAAFALNKMKSIWKIDNKIG